MATSFHSLALTILHTHYREMGYRRPPRILATAHHFESLRQMLLAEDPSLWPYYGRALSRLGRPAIASYLYLKGIGQRADSKRHYTPSDDSRNHLAKLVDAFANGILSELFPSRSFLTQAFPDLDPQELERALKNNPCYFCSFHWICPEDSPNTVQA